MKHAVLTSATAFVLALGLDACSRGDPPAAAAPVAAVAPTASPNSVTLPVAPGQTGAESRVLGLEGLGDLRIGQPAPAGGKWTERGAQTGDSCRTVSSPEYPGVYGIVSDGAVRRITVGQGSDVKLAEGIGIGSTEKTVKGWFAAFREEPHKYESAPAKYLTAPNAASGDLALRFEIGVDGKVRLMHVGTMPVLGYVEGCG